MTEVDAQVLDGWQARRNDPYDEAFYSLLYRDLPTAMILSAGARSDLAKQELTWLLPLLRRNLSAMADDKLIVEVGAGSGVAAAVVSLGLGATVIAVDASPGAAAVIAQVAEVAGAQVEPRVGTARDLAAILDGRSVDALYLFSTMGYLQPHEHSNVGFSLAAGYQGHLDTATPSDEVEAMVSAVGSTAPVYFSEVYCHDRLAELSGVFSQLGRSVSLTDCRTIEGHVIGREQVHIMGAALPTAAPVTVDGLLSMVVKTLPTLRAGDEIEGPSAESIRRAMDDARLVRAREVRYLDGSGLLREEISATEDLTVYYQAATTGYRRIAAARRSGLDASVEAFEDARASLSVSAIVTTLTDPATEW